MGTKVIKRYQNRKLYDTRQSCYVTLEDIAKMINKDEEIIVIDNRTKENITASTMTQIIFETERRSGRYAPLSTLRHVIQTANGSLSGYFAKMGVGVMPRDQEEVQKDAPTPPKARVVIKEGIAPRTTNFASSVAEASQNQNTVKPQNIDVEHHQFSGRSTAGFATDRKKVITTKEPSAPNASQDSTPFLEHTKDGQHLPMGLSNFNSLEE